MNPKFGQNFQEYNLEKNPQMKRRVRRFFDQRISDQTDFIQRDFLPVPPPPPPPPPLLASKKRPIGLIPFLSGLSLPTFWSGFVLGMVFGWVNFIVFWCVVDAFYLS